jgi:hypothetical protein
VDGGQTGALVDNLDLELRYCGADQNCSTAAGDIVYYGNVFTEDVNDDGVEDQNLDGTAGMIRRGRSATGGPRRVEPGEPWGPRRLHH